MLGLTESEAVEVTIEVTSHVGVLLSATCFFVGLLRFTKQLKDTRKIT